MLNAMENYFSELKSVIDNLDRNEIETFINVMLNARNNGKNIYIMGNGGSGATASHFCCDFNKGMSYTKDKKFKMICLNDNVSTMLAYSNDVGYDFVFVEQLKNFVKEGDIVSIDTVALKDGFNGDAARTFLIGKVSKEAKRLVEVTKQAFFEGIKYAKPGNRIGDISHAIGEYVHSQGFSVVREFQGHGIGRNMHEDPGIPNYGKAGRGLRLEPGMTLAIEPMVIQGKHNILELDDGWTIITEDGSLSAHYENTILITEKEPEILTIL